MAAPVGTNTEPLRVKVVVVPPEVTVAPESMPFTYTRMPLTLTPLPAFEGAAFSVIEVEELAVDACELAFEGESILKTEFGLMVTNVSPSVLGEDERPGE